jgi:hypothetical protein
MEAFAEGLSVPPEIWDAQAGAYASLHTVEIHFVRLASSTI